MEKNDIYAEWQKHCEEHEAAQSAYLNAFNNVNKRFAAIGSGASNTNPSAEELSEFEQTWKTWQDVKQRMTDFAKSHA